MTTRKSLQVPISSDYLYDPNIIPDSISADLVFLSKVDKQVIPLQQATVCLNTIKSLVSNIEAKDSYNHGHSEKVTKFALEIAKAMGLSKSEQLLLTYSGRLHDIGKIAISGSILNKIGSLTVPERKQIELHPIKGAEILSDLKFLERCIPIIRHHHERYDGKGYPDGLKDEEIPLLARILGCADAFDAMTSDRAYRPRIPVKDAIIELEANKERQFDPQIVDIFINILTAKDV